MDRLRSAKLLVEYGGKEWALEVDREPVREELVAWLGPWVRTANCGATGKAVAGLVTVEQAANWVTGKSGLWRTENAVQFRSEYYDILVNLRRGAEGARVRYKEGNALDAACLALRLLVAYVTFAEGGLALHAASVKTPHGVLVFAGPCGAGKTSAAGAFPATERLDEDFVLLGVEAGRWVHLHLFDLRQPQRLAPGGVRKFPVRAVLFPAPGESFRLRALKGSSALRACLQATPPGFIGSDISGPQEASVLLDRLDQFIAEVPVARFEWRLSDDLPTLLETALGQWASP